MLATFITACINLWLRTGKRLRYADNPWLRGPMADTMRIGPDFYRVFAKQEGLEVRRVPDGGLVTDFTRAVAEDAPNRSNLHPAVVHFYEHAAAYRFEVWSEWSGLWSWAARALIYLVSREMDQMNIPLHPLETSRGMSNDVIHLCDPETGKLVHACWLRRTRKTGRVVYAGFYSDVRIEGRPYVRVSFPVQHGNATVLLRVDVQPDGSVILVSRGKGIGDAGYYRVRRSGREAVRVKYVPLKETIHVFVDDEGVLRTDHIFYFWRSKFLHLHYKMLPMD